MAGLRGIEVETQVDVILQLMRDFSDKHKYKIGDTLESVAYRQGQHDLIDAVERQLARKK